MEYKLHNGSGGLCCKGCSRQDKKLNTYDWLADIPGNAEECDMVEVQFKNTRKGYYRNSNKIKLEKGDIVAVEAAPGHRCSDPDRKTCSATDEESELQDGCGNKKSLPKSQAGGYGEIQRSESKGTCDHDPCPPDCTEPESGYENR